MPLSPLSFLSRVEREWFWSSLAISLLVIVVYVVLHCALDGEGELIYLTDVQVENANEILSDPVFDTLRHQESKVSGDSLCKLQLTRYLEVVLGCSTMEADTLNGASPVAKTIAPFTVTELKRMLPTLPFKVPSLFWLSGKKAMLEMIFWALFGLIASILYRVTEAIQNREFDARKIPIHLAKIIYAPLSTIILIFSIGSWTSDNGKAFMSVSYGLIVGSFVLGFFSGRTVDLLKRIKDILLPLGGDEEKGLSQEYDLYRLQGQLKFNTLTEPQPEADFTKVRLQIRAVHHPKLKTYIAKVDSNGQFEFPYVETGKYMLQGSYEDGQDVWTAQQIVEVDTEQEKLNLTIYLNQLNESTPS